MRKSKKRKVTITKTQALEQKLETLTQAFNQNINSIGQKFQEHQNVFNEQENKITQRVLLDNFNFQISEPKSELGTNIKTRLDAKEREIYVTVSLYAGSIITLTFVILALLYK